MALARKSICSHFSELTEGMKIFDAAIVGGWNVLIAHVFDLIDF